MKFFSIQQQPIVVGVALLLITLSVNISMPLFRVYAAAVGLSNGQTALVFAAYISGMLPCYVLLGGLSDRLGRKQVLMAAMLCALLATTVVTCWPNVAGLIGARFFQGVAVGLGMGAGTAYISELLHSNPMAASKAAGMASLFTAFGFGGGALATSLVLLIHFSLIPVSYPILIGCTVAGMLALATIPNPPVLGGPLLRLPYFPAGALPLNVAIGICWAATGIVIAIIPTQLAVFGLTKYAGFCLVLVNWTGALLQPLLRKMCPVKAVKIGLWLVPVGFGLITLGSYAGWIMAIFTGAFVIGAAAYGYSYIGGLKLVANLGGPQKARAVSGYMFIGYIGFGIPAVCLGFLSDQIGIEQALLLFEGLIILVSGYIAFALRQHRSIYQSLV